MATLSPTSTYPQRPPPPSLFLPPSRNASNISLSSLAPPPPSQSTQQRPPVLRTRSTRPADQPSSHMRTRPTLSTTQTEGDRTDALWAEMQATLADVEVSAFNSTHVFGPAHSAALEELRAAQIELAKAWGRGVGDDDGDDMEDLNEEKPEGEDGEEDLVVARRRREANEKYFDRVREGVRDVVSRLEGVAGAMGNVERESRDIWSGSESLESISGSAPG